MTTLGVIWYLLVGVLMVGYFVLDGFDLGVGVLYPFIAKDEDEKDTLVQAIGPVWDGNEVWLLTAGGALFAAFAPAYATVFSGFYLAIMLVLFGLILRAVSLEFRSHGQEPRALWDWLFFVGSLLPALLFGVALGNLAQGIPLNAHGDYTGSFFALLNPFALLCGVLGLVHTLAQGSAWIALKAPEGSELHARAKKLRRAFMNATFVIFVVISAWYEIIILGDKIYEMPLFVLAAIAAVAYVAVMGIGANMDKKEGKNKDLAAFIMVSLGAAMLVVVYMAGLFPNFVPAADAALSLNIANCQATDATLLPMTIIACIGVPIMLVYHVIAYKIFAGRVK